MREDDSKQNVSIKLWKGENKEQMVTDLTNQRKGKSDYLQWRITVE